MNWNNFKNKFHSSWHTSVKKFIESKECDKIYTFLKSQKGKEIAPKSAYTFRSFKWPLKDLKVLVLFEEPFCDRYEGMQYADGIPLSCEFIDRLHSQTDTFYNAMEKEFYGFNLNMIKETNVNYLARQGVMFLNSSLTVEVNSPGSHKNLWVPFIKHLILGVFKKKKIPIIFCGEDVYNQYKSILEDSDRYFVIKQPISETHLSIPWNTENKFYEFEQYLYNNTLKNEIMWVNTDVPF